MDCLGTMLLWPTEQIAPRYLMGERGWLKSARLRQDFFVMSFRSARRHNGLHGIPHDVLANFSAHILPDARREPIVETGPDPCFGNLASESLHVGPSVRYAGRRWTGQGDLRHIGRAK